METLLRGSDDPLSCEQMSVAVPKVPAGYFGGRVLNPVQSSTPRIAPGYRATIGADSTRDAPKGRLWLALAGMLLLAPIVAEPAAAAPKKNIDDYSKVCQDEYNSCLKDCVSNYTGADVDTCFGVCEDWLDDACDKVFPAKGLRTPGISTPPSGGVFDPGRPSSRLTPKLAPGGGVSP